MIVRKVRPNRSVIAASARRSSDASEAARAPNTTFPLPRMVFTSVNPAASNAFFKSDIFALTGMTPRRNAALRGMSQKLALGRVPVLLPGMRLELGEQARRQFPLLR